jgi:hypothetical protein
VLHRHRHRPRHRTATGHATAAFAVRPSGLVGGRIRQGGQVPAVPEVPVLANPVGGGAPVTTASVERGRRTTALAWETATGVVPSRAR